LSPNCWICARVEPFWFGVLLVRCMIELKALNDVLSLTWYRYLAENASRFW
jgi:hypothetical protein